MTPPAQERRPNDAAGTITLPLMTPNAQEIGLRWYRQEKAPAH